MRYEDFLTGLPIVANQYYQYHLGNGFKQVNNQQVGSFKGESILAFAHELLTTAEYLLDAKRLMRMVIATLLGDQTLQSRELFQK